MQPNTQYILYLNRNDITYGGGKYKLRIDINNHDADYGYIRQNDFIEIAYMTIGKQQKAGEKTIGLPGENYYSVTIPFDDGIVDLEFLYAFDKALEKVSAFTFENKKNVPKKIKIIFFICFCILQI